VWESVVGAFTPSMFKYKATSPPVLAATPASPPAKDTPSVSVPIESVPATETPAQPVVIPVPIEEEVYKAPKVETVSPRQVEVPQEMNGVPADIQSHIPTLHTEYSTDNNVHFTQAPPKKFPNLEFRDGKLIVQSDFAKRIVLDPHQTHHESTV